MFLSVFSLYLSAWKVTHFVLQGFEDSAWPFVVKNDQHPYSTNWWLYCFECKCKTLLKTCFKSVPVSAPVSVSLSLSLLYSTCTMLSSFQFVRWKAWGGKSRKWNRKYKFREVSVCQAEEANGHYRLDILPTDTPSGACRHQSGMHTTSWLFGPPTG